MPNLTNTRIVRTAPPARPLLASGRRRDPVPHYRDRIPDEVWARPDMRQRLHERDIAGVYRLLQSHGVSQRAIAARTSQSQSEVSEIVAGRRQVAAYDLLV